MGSYYDRCKKLLSISKDIRSMYDLSIKNNKIEDDFKYYIRLPLYPDTSKDKSPFMTYDEFLEDGWVCGVLGYMVKTERCSIERGLQIYFEVKRKKDEATDYLTKIFRIQKINSFSI
jgi:hypothetical protein